MKVGVELTLELDVEFWSYDFPYDLHKITEDDWLSNVKDIVNEALLGMAGVADMEISRVEIVD